MSVDWSQSVQVDSGGYMRLEDFCNSTARGDQLHWTSGILYADEELMGIELGWRVANEAVSLAVEGWGALMDALYAEDIRAQTG